LALEGIKRRDERKIVRRVGGSLLLHRAGYLLADELKDQNDVEPVEPAPSGQSITSNKRFTSKVLVHGFTSPDHA
jgi:hypothetical protein